MKRILITGASGFFGQSLLNNLGSRKEQFECFCLYKNTIPKTFDQRFKWIQHDLFNIPKTKDLMNHIKPSHLIHLAWYVAPQKFWNAQENIDWFFASIELFKIFSSSGGKVFIGAGTLAEYDWKTGILDERTTPLNPNTLYGQCKKSLHEIILSIRNICSYEAKIIWPRIGYFFGAHEPKEKLIPKLIHSIKNDLPMDLASPDFARPYADVKYLGEIITHLLLEEIIQDEVFNLSSSNSYPLKEIVEFIERKTDKIASKVKYNSYASSPIKIQVKDCFLKSKKLHIEDTFFHDLEKLIRS